MKKSLFFLFALICSMSLFTACSDDDDPDYSKVIEEEIAGDYKGALDIKLEGTTIASNLPKNITISKASNSAINLLLAKFSLMGMDLGDIELKDCKLSQKDKSYSFTGTQTLNIEKYQLTADVKAAGTIADGKITVQLDIAAKLNGLSQNVQVTYTGTKMTGNESSEALIKTFTFDSELVTEQPVINEEQGSITFKVDDAATDEELSALIPTITCSDKASVNPKTGVAVDFSNGNSVVYTVIAEDGTVKKYNVSISGRNVVTKYDFDDWEVKTVVDSDWSWEIPNKGGWVGADQALSLVQIMLGTQGVTFNDKSLVSTGDAHTGKNAAKITTLDTHGMKMAIPGFPNIPKITSGSLFLGSFEIDATNTLRSTRFGIEYDKKPLAVKGYYKYIPGKTYYTCPNAKDSHVANIDATKTDECTLSAVLYEVSSYVTPDSPQDLSDERLNGTNIYDSDKIVASAILVSGEKQEYTPFELNLKYLKEFDASKLYRFTIICSSSKEGNSFSGAPGSTLIVDDIEIINE